MPDIAHRLDIKVTRVHQLLRERQLVGSRASGPVRVPAEFLDPATTDGVVKGLTATITLLTDAGFVDDEIISWMFAADETLPGTPIAALVQNRGREVHRRAQVAGF